MRVDSTMASTTAWSHVTSSHMPRQELTEATKSTPNANEKMQLAGELPDPQAVRQKFSIRIYCVLQATGRYAEYTLRRLKLDDCCCG